MTAIRPILEYGVQVWQNIPEFLSNKLESIQKRALDVLNTTSLSSLKERRTQLCCKYIQKMTQRDHPLTSSSREQDLVVIVTTCGLATTIEILFTLIGAVAGPSVQVPLFHSLVNM